MAFERRTELNLAKGTPMRHVPARRLRSVVKGRDVHGNRIEVATFTLAGGGNDYEVDGRPATAAQAEEALAWIDGPSTEERFGDGDAGRGLGQFPLDPPRPMEK